MTSAGVEKHSVSSKKLVALMRHFVTSCKLGDLENAGNHLTLDRWMSKEPAEIFERAAEDGFIQQVRHYHDVYHAPNHLTMSS